MSRSNAKTARGFLLVSTLLVGAWPVGGQAPVSNNQQTVLTRIREFLQTAYPELLGKDLNLNLCTTQSFEGAWRELLAIHFRITRFGGDSGSSVDPSTGKFLSGLPPQTTELFGGLIWFNRRSWLHEMWAADFDVVHAKQNKAIHQLIESHPEWSEAEAIHALKQAGARYGPADKKQFLESLRLEKFEKFMGRLKIESAEFQGLLEPHDGSFVFLEWLVKVKARRRDGTKSAYTLWFEPFEGKLTGVKASGTPAGTIGGYPTDKRF